MVTFLEDNIQIKDFLQKLLAAMSEFETNLENWHQYDLDETSLKLNTMREQLAVLKTQLTALQNNTLLNTRLEHFHDLIICGNKIAQYVVDKPYLSKIIRRHADHWKKMVKQFNPLF